LTMTWRWLDPARYGGGGYAVSDANEKRRRKCVWTLINCIVVLVLILVGMFLSGALLPTSQLTNLYVITEIITTIGYGDHTQRERGYFTWKVFYAIYILSSLIIIAFLLNRFLQDMVDSRVAVFQKRLVRHRKRRIGLLKNTFLSRHGEDLFRFGVAILVLVALTTFGVLFYGTYERCSCSYGITAVEGCTEYLPNTTQWNFEICEETGGQVKYYTDAFYMSVVTFTTVGFGDYSPKTQLGRALGIVWMILGVAAMAMFLQAFAKAVFHWKSVSPADDPRSEKRRRAFADLDGQGRGTLTRSEFMVYMLVVHNTVNLTDVDMLTDLYSELDPDLTNKLEFETIDRQHYLNRGEDFDEASASCSSSGASVSGSSFSEDVEG